MRPCLNLVSTKTKAELGSADRALASHAQSSGVHPRLHVHQTWWDGCYHSTREWKAAAAGTHTGPAPSPEPCRVSGTRTLWETGVCHTPVGVTRGLALACTESRLSLSSFWTGPAQTRSPHPHMAAPGPETEGRGTPHLSLALDLRALRAVCQAVLSRGGSWLCLCGPFHLVSSGPPSPPPGLIKAFS